MNGNLRRAARGAGLALGVALIAAAATPAPASHFETLYQFHGMADGMLPNSAPIIGAQGELYGTTMNGGDASCTVDRTTLGCGLIYRLRPPPTPGGKWTEKVLYSFKGGSDGALNVFFYVNSPGLTLGEDGSLYGVTPAGGGVICSLPGAKESGGCGTAFRLSRAGGTWTETILHRFGHPGDGFAPSSALVPGDNGVLYGAAGYGGDAKCNPTDGFSPTCGVIFQLTPPKTPAGNWTEQIIYTFTDPANANPESDLTLYRGVIYGTTYLGNSPNTGGTVFSLTPPSHKGGKWTYRTLRGFRCPGPGPGNPAAGLVVRSGAVYGTTPVFTSCRATEYGTVFALTQPAKPGGKWDLETLLEFDTKNGAYPTGDLVSGNRGVLFGAAVYGGSGPCTNSFYGNGCGMIWQLAPPAKSGGKWQQTILYSFHDAPDGLFPVAISSGGPHVLYGATGAAGDNTCLAPSGCGTVFKLVH